MGDSIAALSAAAQAAAAALHTQVTAALQAQPPASTSSMDEQQLDDSIAQLVALNTRLVASIGRAADKSDTHQQTDIELEEVRAATAQRQATLQQLLTTLDDSAQRLRAQLDSCHKLLAVPPCSGDPSAILRYAYTLRHGFAPLGAAPGQLQVPPAPQVPFMLHSTLRLYNMELLAQQQQAAAASGGAGALLPPAPPPPALPGAPATMGQPEAGAGAAAAGPQEGGAAAVQQLAASPPRAPQPPQPPAVQFLLNQDLLDELGEVVEEDYSEEEYSDSD
jgi:hypothetical protein